MKEIFDLSRCSWRLKGTAPYVPLRENSMETGKPLEGITGWIPADVPGGIALALYRAGYLPYPYSGMNSLQCEWMENKWWIYETVLELPDRPFQKVFLEFDGVDYACAVYWNGRLLGRHIGMFEPFRFDVTKGYRAGERVLLRMLLEHAPDEMGQIGLTSQTSTQKSRFGYKWDFSTRLVNLGIWQGVRLTFADRAEWTDYFAESDLPDPDTGLISVSAAVCGGEGRALSWKCVCSRGGKEAARTEGTVGADGRVQTALRIPHPAVWFPNGMGEQPLYDLRLSLYDGDRLLDEKRQKTGVRRIRCVPNEGAPAGARPYLFVVNGRKLYVKGVNVTPLDHIYGDVPAAQVEETLGRAREMHCNLVRVWGGGLIETEEFYSRCDEMGLLVWQEFIQSSSGIDNIPSQDPAFLELLRRSAEAAVRQKRCHTCLAVWSGGNELMEADRTPCTEENPNIAMLRRIVEKLDPHRAFLPTSASGPDEFITAAPGKKHDVHGWWQYQGNPAHYRLYAESDSLFHSEFGCDGMSSAASLRRILPPEELRPVPMRENDVWRFHGDWWCTYARETEMFGQWSGLEQYVACSQWMQAEGLRYILEANRRRMFHNSGSIIWQLNEPWPNISCTNLLEYYGRPKMAFYWAKCAFDRVHPVFDYRRLDYAPGGLFSGKIFLLRDLPASGGEETLLAEIRDLSGGLLFRREYRADAGGECSAVPMGELAWRLPGGFRGGFLLRLSAGAGRYRNAYYFSTEPEHPYRPFLSGGAVLSGTVQEDGGSAGIVRIANTGAAAALHLCLEDAADAFLLEPEENFVTLLPGESWTCRVRWRPKFRYGFDENLHAPAAGRPMLAASCLSGEKAELRWEESCNV